VRTGVNVEKHNYVSESLVHPISYAIEFGSSIYAYDISGHALWSKPKPPHTRLAGYSATSVTIEYSPPGGRKQAIVYDSRGNTIRTFYP
jgi:hypothetical protein